MRYVSPLVEAPTPNEPLKPDPAATSGFMKTVDPCHNRAPKNRVNVVDSCVSSVGNKLFAPVYSALNAGLYWDIKVVWA